MTGKLAPNQRLMTNAIHAGETPDPVTRASALSIFMSITFLADASASFSAEDFGDGTPYLYSRWKNPIVTQLEQKLAVLEGADAAMALEDHLIISDVSYAATAEMTDELIPVLEYQSQRSTCWTRKMSGMHSIL